MVGGSDGSTNRCAAIERERVASLDDVKVMQDRCTTPITHRTIKDETKAGRSSGELQ